MVFLGLAAHVAAKTRLTGIDLESEVLDLPPLVLPEPPSLDSSFIESESGAESEALSSRQPDPTIIQLVDAARGRAAVAGSASVLGPSASASEADNHAVQHMARGMTHLTREIEALKHAIAAARSAAPMPMVVVAGQPQLTQPYPLAPGVSPLAPAAPGSVVRPSGPVADLDSLNRGPVGRKKAEPVPVPAVPSTGAPLPTAAPGAPAPPAPVQTTSPATIVLPSPFTGANRGPMGRLKPAAAISIALPDPAALAAGLNAPPAQRPFSLGPTPAPAPAVPAWKPSEAGAGPTGRLDPAKAALEQQIANRAALDASLKSLFPPPTAAAAPAANAAAATATAPPVTKTLTPGADRGPVGKLTHPAPPPPPQDAPFRLPSLHKLRQGLNATASPQPEQERSTGVIPEKRGPVGRLQPQPVPVPAAPAAPVAPAAPGAPTAPAAAGPPAAPAAPAVVMLSPKLGRGPLGKLNEAVRQAEEAAGIARAVRENALQFPSAQTALQRAAAAGADSASVMAAARAMFDKWVADYKEQQKSNK
jgi:hypothetical protein